MGNPDPDTLENTVSSRPKDDTSAVNQSEKLSTALASLPKDLCDLYNSLPDVPSASIDPELAFPLHKLLSALDPAVARRWHWKDVRKVLRSLVIIQQLGRLPSEIIEEQSNMTVLPRCAMHL